MSHHGTHTDDSPGLGVARHRYDFHLLPVLGRTQGDNMKRTERNAIRAAQAAERKALAMALRAATKEEKAAKRAEADRLKSEAQARAAENQHRERETFRTMCRGLVMTRVRAAGGLLSILDLAKAWPAPVARTALDEAIDTLCTAGELIMETPPGEPSRLAIPAPLAEGVK